MTQRIVSNSDKNLLRLRSVEDRLRYKVGYHGTSPLAAREILRKGILPRGDAWGLGPKVWYSSKRAEASSYAYYNFLSREKSGFGYTFRFKMPYQSQNLGRIESNFIGVLNKPVPTDWIDKLYVKNYKTGKTRVLSKGSLEYFERIAMKNTRANLLKNPTSGLVNNVLHKNKINHTIQNATKKATSTINKALRKAAKIILR